MGGQVKIVVDMAKYKYVDLDVDSAISLLERLLESSGGRASDIVEALRYLRNFDEFYSYMRRKFKDYLPLPHRPEDYIKGLAFVDKVKLYVGEDGSKRAVIVFDRRVRTELLKRLLEEAGYSVDVEKSF